MKVSIHQPNFLPWLGIFQRIYDTDTFVFFDHVQANGGKSWVSRNRVKISGKASWLTLPTKKSGRFGQNISDVEINYETDFTNKHLKTLKTNYAKAPHFIEIFPYIEDIYLARHQYIISFNKQFIMKTCEMLNLKKSFVSSSELVKAHKHIKDLAGNELVLALCLALDADGYLSGDGCLDFILPKTFESRGINFSFQKYNHPIYSQYGNNEFISQLSIVDALFNIGIDGVKDLLFQNSIKNVTKKNVN